MDSAASTGRNTNPVAFLGRGTASECRSNPPTILNLFEVLQPDGSYRMARADGQLWKYADETSV